MQASVLVCDINPDMLAEGQRRLDPNTPGTLQVGKVHACRSLQEQSLKLVCIPSCEQHCGLLQQGNVCIAVLCMLAAQLTSTGIVYWEMDYALAFVSARQPAAKAVK